VKLVSYAGHRSRASSGNLSAADMTSEQNRLSDYAPYETKP
jgi:hypothetical protein